MVSRRRFHKEPKLEIPKDDQDLKVWKVIEKCPPEITQECFVPYGIKRLLKQHFIWWAQPHSHDCCCCCHGSEPQLPNPPPVIVNPPPTSGPTAPPIAVDLRLKQNTFGPGKAIYVIAVPAIGGRSAQYVAEWFMEWAATGGSGQVTVELQVKRPSSNSFQTIARGLGPSDNYLFTANTCGTYVFKAIARDSKGNSRFATSSVTAPSVSGIC